MNAEPRSNPVRCVVCNHRTTWADDAKCATCRYHDELARLREDLKALR